MPEIRSQESLNRVKTYMSLQQALDGMGGMLTQIAEKEKDHYLKVAVTTAAGVIFMTYCVVRNFLEDENTLEHRGMETPKGEHN